MSPVRRVRRVIRRIDPWTVLKVSFVFNAIMALAFVLGSIIFWSIFVNAGIPDRLTEFAESLTLSFEVDGELYFRVVLFLSVIWAILMTGLATLGSVLYNLIADTVGGVEVVVLEEVIAPMAAPGGSSVMRPARRPARQRPSVGRSQSATPSKAAITPQQPKAAPAVQPEATANGEATGDRGADLPTAETRVAP
ncbi:MAG: DUF3566 domain-containing protein [Acidimicrobiia bacterium]|nr:DUF3566 domain-containing protein [Acidimicrobiia bacterium]